MGDEHREKDSFVLYTEYRDIIEDLTDEQCGQLFRAIFEYQISGEIMQMDSITKMAFKFIKSQLDRDAEKYAETCEKRREAGKLGGRPKKTNGFEEKQKKQTVISKSKQKQTKAKKPDNDNDDDNDDEDEDDNDINNNTNPLYPSYMNPRARLDVTMYSAKEEGG